MSDFYTNATKFGWYLEWDTLYECWKLTDRKGCCSVSAESIKALEKAVKNMALLAFLETGHKR